MWTNITDSVERVLRYITPGVAFCLLFFLSYPSKLDEVIPKIPGSGLAIFLIILTIGMSIYVIHSLIIRFSFEQLAYLFGISPVNIFSNDRCLCNYSKSHAKLIISRNRQPEYPKDYYVYLWAIVHYSLIISWLLLFFACFHEDSSWTARNSSHIVIAGGIILSLSIISYFYMQALEKNTTAQLLRNKTDKMENENQTDD